MGNELLYAYLAGCIDSDGCLTIKRNTYHMRVLKDACNPVFSERVHLKQVTPQVPHLLRDTFGGALYHGKGQTPNSKALWVWMASDRVASNVCRALRPYIRIKVSQCDALLKLRDWRDRTDAARFSWWWEKENPDWRTYPMITSSEVAKLLHYKDRASVSQATRNGTILAVAPKQGASKLGEQERFPRLLVEALAKHRSKSGKYPTPRQLITEYETLYRTVKALNTIGISGTSVNHRTGFHTPLVPD